ncbi:hypothetical protein [Shewanella algae]|nr:hypothetical protein [Shewanella algae]
MGFSTKQLHQRHVIELYNVVLRAINAGLIGLFDIEHHFHI